jgi:tetrahydromethanopterin S-methyltransferase subunit G
MAIPFMRKKPEDDLMEMPPEFPPLQQGMQGQQLRDLTNRGFGSPDILSGAEAAGMRPAGPVFARPGPAPVGLGVGTPAGMPAPPSFTPPRARPVIEEIEEVAEAVVSEKWQKFSKEVEDMKHAQDDISSSIGGMQERMNNLEKKMDMVIREVLGKVDEYGKSISDVGTELKAMQKVFGTMVPAMTENVKELQELVGTAKEKGIQRKRRRK